MRRICLLMFLTLISLNQTLSAQETVTALGSTFTIMSSEQIKAELLGQYYVHRPPKGAFHDPDYGSLGMKTDMNGLTLLNAFAQTIYPPQGSGNINGEVTDNARYYNGKWYKGINKGRNVYLLLGHKISVESMCFANCQWIGNKTENIPTKAGSFIVLIQEKDGTWYYYSKAGSFPFKKRPLNN